MNAGSPSPKVNSVQATNASKTSAPARKLQAISLPIPILPAYTGQFPYVVGLRIRNKGAACTETALCTGVLYDYNFVLTAGNHLIFVKIRSREI